MCWLLINRDGYFLAGICGTVLQWAASADAVPPELRFNSYLTVKDRWLALRQLAVVEDEGLAVRPVDFYAHRNSPQLWCAACD